MSGHTPGPWFVHPTRAQVDVFDADGKPAPICQLLWPTVRRTEDETMANANVIAATPELLEALELLHDNLAEYQRINNLGGYDNHDMQMARAAIAKAKGEQP